jgi:hypothetical protein
LPVSAVFRINRKHVIGERRDHVGVLDGVLGIGQDDIAEGAELIRQRRGVRPVPIAV